jgi:hypothetical protein
MPTLRETGTQANGPHADSYLLTVAYDSTVSKCFCSSATRAVSSVVLSRCRNQSEPKSRKRTDASYLKNLYTIKTSNET